MSRAEEPMPKGVAAWEPWAHRLLLAWFALRIALLAFGMSSSLPPDETTHMGRILAFREGLGIPRSGPANYEFGLLDRAPWLYYWVMARGLAFNFFPLRDLVFVRLLDGVLGLATACIGLTWFRSWCSSPWSRILFTVLLTNTLMFTGLSGSVSYDTAANLLAAALVLALARFRDETTARTALQLTAVMLAGCLVKRTFLPLAVLVALLASFRALPNLRSLVDDARQSLRSRSGALLVLSVLVLALFAGELYGGNLLRYGRVIPEFDQVVGKENAMANRIHARNRIVRDFRAGSLRPEEAERLVRRLPDPMDQSSTLYLLRAGRAPDSNLMGVGAYALSWSYRMLKTSVGFLGHRRAMKGDVAVGAYAMVFGVAALLLALRSRRGIPSTRVSGRRAEAVFLAVGYALVLLLFVNYPNYRVSHSVDLAIQGRYLFPVLVPIYGLVAWSLGELTPRRLRAWTLGAVIVLYLGGDLPWLLWRHPDLLGI